MATGIAFLCGAIQDKQKIQGGVVKNHNRCLRLQILLATAFTLSISTSATAALVDRGGGLIYDTNLNITWLQNANYLGATPTFDGAWNWAQNLSYYDSLRNVTWDSWRLPKGEELSAMYWGNGISASSPGPFINLQPAPYWGWDYEQPIPNSPIYSLTLNMSDGDGGPIAPDYAFYAWAVRYGDVGAAPVPVPAAVWLFFSGLIGLFGIIRERN